MAGEDTSSAELAPPPREPLTVDGLTASLPELEAALVERTQRMGLRRWFWGEGVCLLALVRSARSAGRPIPGAVRDFARSYLVAPPVLDHVNNLAPGAAVAELQVEDPDPRYVDLLRACLEWYESSPAATRAPNGALEHWPGGVWADTVYMAGQFLLRAAPVLERPDLQQEAVDQWLAHAAVLQDEHSGLFTHGTHGGVRIDCYWGRANAWIALAGADLVATANGANRVDEVAERLRAQLRALAGLQPAHGVWDVLVDSHPEVRGVLETSAAAGIGAAMLRVSTLLPATDGASQELRAAGSRAVRGALAYVQDGELTRVSAGTVLQLIPFGYSVIRDDRIQPWGQGLALEAVAAWREVTGERGGRPTFTLPNTMND